MKVLIADDSASARLMIQSAVELLGHTCVVAEDGTQAWRLFRDTGADVIISDWVMPGLEGPELCRRVREHGGPYTYLILLTVLEDKQYALTGMRAGADDYLTKPLDLGELHVRLIAAERVTTLHRRLAQRDAERERTLAQREALLRGARQFAAGGSSSSLLTEMLELTATLVEGDDAEVSFWESEKERLVVTQTLNSPENRGYVPALEGTASGRAARTRRPVIINDYQREIGAATPFGRAGVQASLVVPLLHEGRLLGTLSAVSSTIGKQFTLDDEETLELLASLAAANLVGLERARLAGVLLAARTAQHELNNQLSLTVGYAEVLSLAPSLPANLRRAAREALSGAERAAHLLDRLQRVTHIHETDWGPMVPTTLDLSESDQNH